MTVAQGSLKLGTSRNIAWHGNLHLSIQPCFLGRCSHQTWSTQSTWPVLVPSPEGRSHVQSQLWAPCSVTFGPQPRHCRWTLKLALSIAIKRLEDWAGISVPKTSKNMERRHYAQIWLDSAPQHFLKQFSVFKVHKLLGSGLNILQFLGKHGKLLVPLWQMLWKLQFLPATLFVTPLVTSPHADWVIGHIGLHNFQLLILNPND